MAKTQEVQMVLDLKSAAKSAREIAKDRERLIDLLTEDSLIAAQIEEAEKMEDIDSLKDLRAACREQALDASTEYLEACEDLKKARGKVRREARELFKKRKAAKEAAKGLKLEIEAQTTRLVEGLRNAAK